MRLLASSGLLLVASLVLLSNGVVDARSNSAHRPTPSSSSPSSSSLISSPRHDSPGYLGVDVSDAVNATTFACLVEQGDFVFTVVRAWHSLCYFDGNSTDTIQAAWDGGMQSVDVYLFPAFECNLTASEQVTETILSLALADSQFGILWFDIEEFGSNWNMNDTSENIHWLKQGIRTAVELLGEDRVGIYSSNRSWTLVMNNVTGFGEFPMWYAHYDNNQTFSDFIPFGSWIEPSIKQFDDGPEVCGASIDHNWVPAQSMERVKPASPLEKSTLRWRHPKSTTSHPHRDRDGLEQIVDH